MVLGPLKIGVSSTSALSHFRTAALDLTVDRTPIDAYDFCFSLMVLHHIPDTRGFFSALKKVLLRLKVRSMNWSGKAMSPGGISSFILPTALTETMRSTPSFFMA